MLYRSFLLPLFLSLTVFNAQAENATQHFCKTPDLHDQLIERLKKKLPADYQALAEALKNNQVTEVETLFAKNPFLKNYAMSHEDGSPLDFARSLAMAEFLVGKIGFDANLCDQGGSMPSKTILSTPDRFFATPQEKQKIADYYQAREGRFAKLYYQLTRNKKVHQTACAVTVAALVLALDIYLLKSAN